MKLSTTLLLTIFTANIIFTMQLIKLQNLSENLLNLNYKATILLLHISIQIFPIQSLPTFQAYQKNSRKHNGKSKTIYYMSLLFYLYT
jgi:hypothetical protein